jgi:hypothetical protein
VIERALRSVVIAPAALAQYALDVVKLSRNARFPATLRRLDRFGLTDRESLCAAEFVC